MFSLDHYLFEFVGGNAVTLYVFITLLKGVALITPSTTDDKIVTLLSNMFTAVKKRKVPDDMPQLDAASKTKEEDKHEEVPQTSDNIH